MGGWVSTCHAHMICVQTYTHKPCLSPKTSSSALRGGGEVGCVLGRLHCSQGFMDLGLCSVGLLGCLGFRTVLGLLVLKDS